MLMSYALPETNVRIAVVGVPELMQASLHAPPGEWSGNPAVLGWYALRPVALRPRLSNGFALLPAVSGGQSFGARGSRNGSHLIALS
jgi:hypothetical protein